MFVIKVSFSEKSKNNFTVPLNKTIFSLLEITWTQQEGEKMEHVMLNKTIFSKRDDLMLNKTIVSLLEITWIQLLYWLSSPLFRRYSNTSAVKPGDASILSAHLLSVLSSGKHFWKTDRTYLKVKRNIYILNSNWI